MAILNFYTPIDMFSLSLMFDIHTQSISRSLTPTAWGEKLDDSSAKPNVRFYATAPDNPGFSLAEDGSVTGGNVDLLEVYDDTLKLYDFSGINMSASTVSDYIAKEDDRNFMGNMILGDDSITGSDYADHMWSYDGADTINGGKGADTMEGGFGNDVYYVGTLNDQIWEIDPKADQSTIMWELYTNRPVYQLYSDAADLATDPGTGFLLEKDTNVPRDNGSGIDEVIASVSGYTLPQWVERLTLAGSDDIDGYGNTLNNVLRGNSGNNLLRGGEGSDVLNGRKGADTLDLTDKSDDPIYAADRVVIGEGQSTVSLDNRDIVLGFQTGEDRLDLPSNLIAGNVSSKDGVDDKVADNVVIKSHRITDGLIQFDDAGKFSAPLKINDANLASVLNYLSANIGGHEAVAFQFDGKVGGTYVFSDSGSTTSADNLVLLQDVSAAGLTYINPIYNASYANDIWIV